MCHATIPTRRMQVDGERDACKLETLDTLGLISDFPAKIKFITWLQLVTHTHTKMEHDGGES